MKFKSANDEGVLGFYLGYYISQLSKGCKFDFDEFIELSETISKGKVPFLANKNDEEFK